MLRCLDRHVTGQACFTNKTLSAARAVTMCTFHGGH